MWGHWRTTQNSRMSHHSWSCTLVQVWNRGWRKEACVGSCPHTTGKTTALLGTNVNWRYCGCKPPCYRLYTTTSMDGTFHRNFDGVHVTLPIHNDIVSFYFMAKWYDHFSRLVNYTLSSMKSFENWYNLRLQTRKLLFRLNLI